MWREAFGGAFAVTFVVTCAATFVVVVILVILVVEATALDGGVNSPAPPTSNATSNTVSVHFAIFSNTSRS